MLTGANRFTAAARMLTCPNIGTGLVMRGSRWRSLGRERTRLICLSLSVAAIAVVVTASLWGSSDSRKVSFRPGEMPGCDQPVVTQLLRNALTESPPGAARNVAVLGVSSIAEKTGGHDRRVCAATVFTSAGNYQITYTIEWIDAAKDKLWLHGDVLSRYL